MGDVGGAARPYRLPDMGMGALGSGLPAWSDVERIEEDCDG